MRRAATGDPAAVLRMVLSGVMALAVLAPRPAAACSCAGLGWFLPADGSTGVPAQLAEIIYEPLNYGSTVSLVSDTETISLGTPVRLWPGYSGEFRVPILAPLAPSTTYRLTSETFTLLTFTTGVGPDLEAPPALAFGSLEIARADIQAGTVSSCGNIIVRFRATLESTGEAPAALAVSLTGPGEPQDFLLPYPYGLRLLTNESCGIDVAVGKREEYCVEIRGRDLVGNLGPPVSQCAVVRACADIADSPGDLFSCPEEWPDVPPGPEPGTGPGCSTTDPGGGLVVLLAALPLARRRRR